MATSATEETYQTNQAFAAGLAAAALSACLGPVSGAHANPAVTCAMLMVRAVSPLRAVLYVCAQCGGAIAGAALVLGVLGSINDATVRSGGGTFGMEFVLTFLVVYAYCAARDTMPRFPIRIPMTTYSK